MCATAIAPRGDWDLQHGLLIIADYSLIYGQGIHSTPVNHCLYLGKSRCLLQTLHCFRHYYVIDLLNVEGFARLNFVRHQKRRRLFVVRVRQLFIWDIWCFGPKYHR